MGELKPCPFCGWEAEVYDYEYGIDPAVAYGCKCEQCGIAMSGYDSYSEAIEAWNTRHERTCHNAGREYGYQLVFMCSECGELDVEGTAYYCRWCGARIEEDANA